MNITPDMWPADTEALRTRITRLEAQSETRRLQIEYMKARIQAVRDEAPTIPADGNDRAWLIMSDLEAGGLFAWQDVLDILDASPN